MSFDKNIVWVEDVFQVEISSMCRCYLDENVVWMKNIICATTLSEIQYYLKGNYLGRNVNIDAIRVNDISGNLLYGNLAE